MNSHAYTVGLGDCVGMIGVWRVNCCGWGIMSAYADIDWQEKFLTGAGCACSGLQDQGVKGVGL
jgi:hypothetical protein